MNTIKVFKFAALSLILFLCMSCETLLKTPTKSSGQNSRGTTLNKRTTPTNQRNTNHYRYRTHSTSRPPVRNNNTERTSTSVNNANVPSVVKIARTYSGTPYRLGGNDKSGIDCSGLICSVYSEAGLKVPRISWQQSEFGREIENIREIKPGDWVFFVPEAGKEGYVSHSGIVTEIRNNSEIIFIHASTSKGVREDNLYSSYFKNRFVKAMRPF